jgi:membrane associated rhomboid family serine protease
MIFYVVGGVAASALHIFFNTDSFIPTVGASGAIGAVLGAYFLFYPFHRVRTLIIFGYFIMVRNIPAVFLIGVWALLQLFSGLGSLTVTTAQGGGVAFWAHIGGFAAGLAVVAAGRLLHREPVWQPHGARRNFRF